MKEVTEHLAPRAGKNWQGCSNAEGADQLLGERVAVVAGEAVHIESEITVDVPGIEDTGLHVNFSPMDSEVFYFYYWKS